MTCSVPVVLQPFAADASCPSLAHLQPSLSFSTGATAPGMSAAGLLLGPRAVNTSAAGIALLQQSAVAFLYSAVPADGGYHLLAHLGTTSAASGSIRLPGSIVVAVRP
jgi:hypothetical protein